MDIDKVKRCAIVGLGKSGLSLCRLLLSLGKKVKITEKQPADNFPSSLLKRLNQQGVEVEFGGHSKNFIQDCQLLILSPGVDVKKDNLLKLVRELGILMVGEIEFSFWFNKANIIAITGTNGKTTTAFLTYKVLRRKNWRVFLGGNIGIPFSSFVLNTKKNDMVVLEVSSFQLETIMKFRPFISCLLNVAPDHFDRYNSFDEYVEAKKKIFKNQTEEDWAVLNKNLPSTYPWEKEIKAKISYFSSEFANENLSCVYKIATILGINKSTCREVFTSFKGLPHRMQEVAKIKGVKFINDSKSTNPSSTLWAVKNIPAPIILLAGGRDKGLNYSSLIPHLKKIKKVYLFGEASWKIEEALYGYTQIEVFSSLKAAVYHAFQEAEEGDTILFSPMCSSFDAFTNYRERGRRFVEIVKELM